MKELAAIIWVFIIQCDVIRNLRIVLVEKHSPTYWKTTVGRILVGAGLNLSFPLSMQHHLYLGVFQVCVYAFLFDIQFNLPRIEKRPLLYMGSASLPERWFKNDRLKYFIIKVWLFLAGIMMLFYNEIANANLNLNYGF